MSIPYTQPTMANVRAVEGTYISYPFLEDGDTSTKVYNMICTQRESDYSSAQISLDDPMSNAASAGVLELPFPADASAYFVGDTNHTPIGGGIISFTRTFANIPQSITIPAGSSFVTFPGIGTGHMAITGATMTMSSPTSITLEFSQTHGFALGDLAYIKGFVYTQEDGGGNESDVTFGSETSTWQQIQILEVVTAYKIRIYAKKTFTETVTLTPLAGEVWNRESNNFTISSIAMNPLGQGIAITTSVAHNIDAGQTVNISMQFTVGSDPFVNVVTGRYEVLSSAGSVSFVVDVGMYWNQSETLYVEPLGQIRNVGSGRKPISYNVSTSMQYDYILPGVSSGVSNVLDVVPPQTFQVVSPGTGDVIDTATNGYVRAIGPESYFFELATLPSASQYKAIVGAGGHIVIESTLSEWSGNILVMKTKTCRAR